MAVHFHSPEQYTAHFPPEKQLSPERKSTFDNKQSISKLENGEEERGTKEKICPLVLPHVTKILTN